MNEPLIQITDWLKYIIQFCRCLFQGYLAMTDFNVSSYVYLDPGQADNDSDVENDEHDGAAGLHEV